MSLGAHTSAFGTHAKDDTIGTYKVTAYNEDGSYNSEYSEPVRSRVALSVRQEPNKGPYRMSGYTKSKDYSREIHLGVCEANREYRIDPVDGHGYSYVYSIPQNPGTQARTPVGYDDFGANLKAMAITKALNSLRGDKSLQLGADLGEARKTIDMIADPFISLLKAYRQGRRGNWGAIPKILGMSKRDVLTGKSLSNRWLEYQYGWKPLMGAVYDGTEVLRKGFGFPSVSRCARAHGKGKGTYADTIPSEAYEINLSGEITVRCGLTYTMSNATIASLDAAGVLNPASIAWELVPFSFVVDWFVPVGNVLSAMSATAGLQFVDGYISETRDWRESVKDKDFSGENGGIRTTMSKPGVTRTDSYYFARRGLNDFPTPQFYTTSNPFSTAHVKNALALLRQLL